jgi:hypothetical protein
MYGKTSIKIISIFTNGQHVKYQLRAFSLFHYCDRKYLLLHIDVCSKQQMVVFISGEELSQ